MFLLWKIIIFHNNYLIPKLYAGEVFTNRTKNFISQTGSISEREHLKWLNNSVVLKNNPYSTEVLHRRIDRKSESADKLSDNQSYGVKLYRTMITEPFPEYKEHYNNIRRWVQNIFIAIFNSGKRGIRGQFTGKYSR